MSYAEVEVLCPYYISSIKEAGQCKIRCSWPGDYCTVQQVFSAGLARDKKQPSKCIEAAKRAYSEHLREYCCKDYRSCEVYLVNDLYQKK